MRLTTENKEEAACLKQTSIVKPAAPFSCHMPLNSFIMVSLRDLHQTGTPMCQMLHTNIIRDSPFLKEVTSSVYPHLVAPAVTQVNHCFTEHKD